MNPISEINWALKEHKNRLGEFETQHQRRLGNERPNRRDSKAKTAGAKRTLIALSTKPRQLFGAAFGVSVARSLNDSRPETSTNQ